MRAITERVAAWFDVKDVERRAIAREITERSSGDLEVARVVGAAAVFLHRRSGVLFHLVPGGETNLGFDDASRDRLRAQYQYWDECDESELALDRFFERKRARVTVKPFLFAARPLGSEQLEAFARGEVAPMALGRELPDLRSMAKLSADKWALFLESFSAGTFTNQDIPEVERALARVGLRLPSEAEREHAARAGTENLFPHGDDIPSVPNVAANRLGIVELGADTEVCADGWVATLEGIPTDGTPRPASDERVVRGGAAACYPWQGCAEWTLLLCAHRASSKSHDGFLVARPVLGLGI
jgi:formylglycine-generating enzyme required for sulfatase activity